MRYLYFLLFIGLVGCGESDSKRVLELEQRLEAVELERELDELRQKLLGVWKRDCDFIMDEMEIEFNNDKIKGFEWSGTIKNISKLNDEFIVDYMIEDDINGLIDDLQIKFKIQNNKLIRVIEGESYEYVKCEELDPSLQSIENETAADTTSAEGSDYYNYNKTNNKTTEDIADYVKSTTFKYGDFRIRFYANGIVNWKITRGPNYGTEMQGSWQRYSSSSIRISNFAFVYGQFDASNNPDLSGIFYLRSNGNLDGSLGDYQAQKNFELVPE